MINDRGFDYHSLGPEVVSDTTFNITKTKEKIEPWLRIRLTHSAPL
jgi:hypothetical protein